MEWYYELEEKLLPTLVEVARSNISDVRHAELDFMNRNVQLVVPNKVKRQTIKDVETAIMHAGNELIPEATEWPIFIPLPPQHTYTSHLGTSPRVIRQFGRPESVVVYDIPFEHILSMREAERIITKASKDFQYTVAFALGGISILGRLSKMEFEKVMPMDPFSVPDAAEDFSRRFHLFPGLQWKGTDGKEIFLDWLSKIPGGYEILIFDTGTSGNGPRQVVNLLRDSVSEEITIQAGSVHLIAVVDREDKEQKAVDEIFTTKDGNKIHVTLNYERVERMLSEDCQRLLGHDSIRSYGYVQPVRDNCVVRLLNGTGRPIHVIASTCTSGVYSAMMIEAEKEPDESIRVTLSPEGEKAMVEKILADARWHEYIQLGNASGLDMITEERYRAEHEAMMRRYESALNRYPSERWDFKKKKIVKV